MSQKQQDVSASADPRPDRRLIRLIRLISSADSPMGWGTDLGTDRAHQTASMPWAGVALMAHALRRSFPYLQGVFAFLVASSWTRFKTVVTCGSLPKSSHGGRRSGGLPTPRLPLLVVAGARVWVGGLAGPAARSGTDRGCVGQVIHRGSLTHTSQPPIERLFYNSRHGEQSAVLSGATPEPGYSPLLGSAYGARAGPWPGLILEWRRTNGGD